MATFNSSPVEDIQLFSHFVMLVSPLCRCNPVRSALPHSPSDASNIMNSLMFATEDEFKVIIQKLTIIHDLSAPLIKLLRLRRHLKTTVIKLEEAKDIAKLDVWTFMGLELLTLSISLQLFFKICLSVASSDLRETFQRLISHRTIFAIYRGTVKAYMYRSCDIINRIRERH